MRGLAGWLHAAYFNLDILIGTISHFGRVLVCPFISVFKLDDIKNSMVSQLENTACSGGRKVGAAAAAVEEDTWKQTNGRQNDRTRTDERRTSVRSARKPRLSVRPSYVRPRPSFPLLLGRKTVDTVDSAVAAYTWRRSPI